MYLNYVKKVVAMLLFLVSVLAYAQPDTLQLQKDAMGNITFARFNDNHSGRMTDAKGFLQRTLKPKAGNQFERQAFHTDEIGMEHVTYQQFYKGVKVEGANYVLHGKNDVIIGFNGQYAPVQINSVIPSVSEQEALSSVKQHLQAEHYAWEDDAKEKFLKEIMNNPTASYYPVANLLIVRSGTPNEWKLAWNLNIVTLEPYESWSVYINAHTGDFIGKISQIHHGNSPSIATTQYSGTQNITTDSFSGGYRLWETRNGVSIKTQHVNNISSTSPTYNFVDNDNNWTAVEYHNGNEDQAALDVHWALEKTLDYWRIKRNRNSYDGIGGRVIGLVHHGVNSNNAAWVKGENIMYFGDGSTSSYTTLDIVAHEFGHGVNLETSNLRVTDSNVPISEVIETKTLIEGFSDIWGAVVEEWAAPEKDEWLMGEELTNKPPTRSMQNPNSNGQPDTYLQSGYWSTTDFHKNATVVGYWFYLLSEGGDGVNGIGQCYDVLGIGIDKAAKIVYHAQKARWVKDQAKFINARSGTISAAIDLYGVNSNEAIAVENAWHAVGVGSKHSVYYSISNTDYVCVSNNDPVVLTTSASDVSWSVSPSYLFATNSGTGVEANLQAKNSNSSGWATLTYTADSRCTSPVTKTHTFWVGSATYNGGLTNGNLLGWGGITNNVCENEWIQTDLTFTGNTSFNWQKLGSSSNVHWGQTGNNIRFHFWQQAQTATFRLTLTNDCQNKVYDFTFESYECSSTCTQYTVSPNPAKLNVNIALPPDPCTTSLSASSINKGVKSIRSIRVLTKEGFELDSYNFEQNLKNVDFNVLNYTDGLYFLEISDGEYVERHRLIVEK